MVGQICELSSLLSISGVISYNCDALRVRFWRSQWTIQLGVSKSIYLHKQGCALEEWPILSDQKNQNG